MNWEEAIGRIESHEFAVNLGVASSIRAFFRAAAEDTTVEFLRRRMLESGEACQEILGRIYDLAKIDIDIRYENPNDIPLAVLLWLIYYTSFDSKVAAYYVGQAPNCWYGRKLARRLLVPPKSETADTSGGVDGQQVWTRTNDSLDSVISINPGYPQDRLRGYAPSTGDENGTSGVHFQLAS